MEFFKNKGIGFYFGMFAFVLTVISFGCYMTAANDSYGYDKNLITIYVILLVLNTIFLIKDFFELGPILLGIMTGAMFGIFVKTRLTYFITGYMGISQDGLDIKIIVALICLLVITILNICGAFFSAGRIKLVEGDAKKEKNEEI